MLWIRIKRWVRRLPMRIRFKINPDSIRQRIKHQRFLRWLKEDERQRKEGRIKALESITQDRLYDGNDEFHPSLDINLKAAMYLTKDEFDDYMEDLVRRRMRMHNKDPQ